MKTSGRSITLFSFFPAIALLATPLLFSTLAPASTGDFTVDSSDWIVPQSFMTTDEVLEAENVRNKDIGEVKFLQYDRDYIYMAEDGDSHAAHDVSSADDAADDSRNEPAITDQGEIDTAYVLQNPEFKRQVEELSAQANQAGAAMPPLLTLVALFAFVMATGSATLKEFFKFSTYTDKVKKTIQVTKKVAKTVYRTITETVARKVKTVKTVAYTAYETNVVQVTPPPSRDKLYELAYFMRVNFVQNLSSFSRPFQRDARYYLPNMSDEREWDNFKAEYDGIASGRKVERTVLKLQEYFSSPAHTNVGRSFNTISDYFFEGIQFTEPALYKKLKKEFDAIVKPVTDPIVNSTGKPYTAYRDEVETKTVYDTITREVPETIYEDITEDREITEDVTKHSFTPLNEKIDLAIGYLKNYQRILQSPSNRNFSDDVLIPNRDLSIFAGTYDVYEKLVVELRDANIYNMDRTDPEWVKEILRRHNEFIYSMKGILTKIQKGKTPEEQMALMFGKDYTDSIIGTENAIASAEADEKALTARFNEIEELLRTNKISTGYYRSLYSSAKKNRDQLYRRKRDAEKNLKKAKEYYAHKFNGTVASLQNLSFLRSLDDWRKTLDQGDRSVAASRLVPFTTANGSVIYRKPARTTTTQAKPKKIIPRPAVTNLTSTNVPQNLTTASSSYLDTLLRISKTKTAKAEPENGKVISEKVLGSSNPLARWWRSTKGGYSDAKSYLKNLESELEVDYMTGKKTKRQKVVEGLMLDVSSFILPTMNAMGQAVEPFVEKSIDVMDYITNNSDWSLQSYFGEKVYDTSWYKQFYTWWISEVEPTYAELQNSWNGLPETEKRTFKTAASFYATVLTFYGATRFAEGGFAKMAKPLSVYSDDVVFGVQQPFLTLESIINASKKAKSGFEERLGKVAAMTEGEAVIPSLKTDTIEGMIRTKEKIAKDYRGNARQLNDVLRGSIVYNDMNALQNSLKALTKNAKVLEVEDRFVNPLRSGYRDVKVLIEEPNGVIAEVQLHIKEMIRAKEFETPIYQEFRELEELLSQTADVAKIQKISSKMENLNSKSREIFNEAWSEFLRRTNQ